ncbi:tRNA uridine-5-carboxymethylaminomethyl(34) synthesis enzyme MnmG [Anaerotruncus colihominis]|uniref:tRNA uridine 5-carboxymethylaminomethyl modification enzyme MnmG n=1 Tax=Anaerotruncus colihominis TaxID=169435 RepID=A0A845SVP4_9FIRM|nr:tRNA uridine-5-carboxymethylaminomethyl(34) synthesis enzyme MnmG [Anaerotruncus colihominis]MCR2026427.1 tRNA uridine-5-carboxymethylaminomethyl(34) synthesis enzyme MnmG [Anaerotruncus colihominis]NDO40586.1 tRNA uridine-5-carboxymethylaminomethyl(34) synthesis enzyme MnmG [Anaerotruncus colihominis]
MDYEAGNYDIAVIGGGHAGIESALAAARLGAHTVLFTMSLDAIGNMPCNPSIGGTAKGHLVREIDALGGEMGRAADAAMIQSRMLNRGKGPAVHSLRAQADRRNYHCYMKRAVENQDGLDVIQAEIVDIRTSHGAVESVVTALGALYHVRAVILCTGTYLRGRIFVGEYTAESGPDGLHAAGRLTAALERLGLPLRRFKTGTPARADRRSIDFQMLEIQEGDDPVTPFSFETDAGALKNQAVCHIAYTNEQTHRVIMENLHRSPLYSGQIEGIGPRYCPSIEDKVVRFSDKPRHQIFIEPMGLDTNEVYLQGMSSSLPEEVQVKLYRTVKGFERIRIMRNAYAIEYDCLDPTCLQATLECKAVRGLYGAGQFNGTSGYEEAAAQGLIAGINAAHAVQGKPPLVLDRASSYIGTLIDDLVVKGCNDPYRMMTSRSEYRLILRQDNADMRLTPVGHKIGLIGEKRWLSFLAKRELVEGELKRLRAVHVAPSEGLNKLLVSRETSPVATGTRLCELLKRPQLSYASLAPFDPGRPDLPAQVCEQVEITIKYEGYIKKQLEQVEQMRRLEGKQLPHDLDYQSIGGLRLEAVEKLTRLRPLNIGQASRISGVSPADVSVLLIWLSQRHTSAQKTGEDDK